MNADISFLCTAQPRYNADRNSAGSDITPGVSQSCTRINNQLQKAIVRHKELLSLARVIRDREIEGERSREIDRGRAIEGER